MNAGKSTGQIAHWPMNDNAASTVVADTGRNNLAGVFNDAGGDPNTDAHTVAGPTGQANTGLSFDGSDDFVESNIQIVSGYPFTTSAWINTTSGAALEGILILADSSTGGVQYGISIASGKAIASSRNTTTRTATSTTDVDNGVWHHVVGVFTNDNLREIYVDGVWEANNTDAVTYAASVNRWSIGRYGDSSPDFYLTGSISDVRVFSQALTYPEIRKLYRAGGGQ